ncbi:MAG: alpha/beta fold hydrolase [Nitratireductor sp.]
MDNTPYFTDSGGDGVPLVLLHGFAGTGAAWEPVTCALSAKVRLIVFDLPGHGKSASMDHSGGTRAMADTVLDTLAHLGIGRAHFCGHSMGGAVACLAAMARPQMVASLTLLAPGAFGREINSRLLRRHAAASTREQLVPILEQFYGWATPVPQASVDAFVADRQRSGACETYCAIAERILDGEHQKVLPFEKIAALNIPVKVIWGTQDRVTPTRQAHKLPGVFATHVFENTGHALIDEITDEIVRLILENMR